MIPIPAILFDLLIVSVRDSKQFSDQVLIKTVYHLYILLLFVLLTCKSFFDIYIWITPPYYVTIRIKFPTDEFLLEVLALAWTFG